MLRLSPAQAREFLQYPLNDARCSILFSHLVDMFEDGPEPLLIDIAGLKLRASRGMIADLIDQTEALTKMPKKASMPEPLLYLGQCDGIVDSEFSRLSHQKDLDDEY